MKQHADGALRALEDAGDLGRAHLVDEAKHDRPPPVAGKPAHGGPRGRGVRASDGASLHVVGRRHACRSLEGRGRPAPLGSAVVGDHVAGDPEKPDAERRGLRAGIVGRRLAEARQRAEREHERPFRHVLRLVVVAQLVVGEAVDLGQVLPVERVEPRRVGLGGPDERPVRVERDHPPGRAGRHARPISSKHRARPSVTRRPRGSSRGRIAPRPGPGGDALPPRRSRGAPPSPRSGSG